MNEVIIIAAIAKNNVIGKDGKIPWHISDDFKHFKEITTGSPVIMGRKTFESLPIKPLPGRLNIVVSREFSYPGVMVMRSLDDAVKFCSDKKKTFLIGGASIYEQGMKFADRLELTIIDKEYEGDTFFPKVNFDEWTLVKKEDKGWYSFNSYVKKK